MPTFPLPLNFFNCTPLNSNEIKNYKKLSKKISTDLINNSMITNNTNNITWRLTNNEKDLKIYEGIDQNAPSGVVSWCSITNIIGNLNEISNLFQSNTTIQYKDNNRILAKNDLLDCAHLYTILNTSIQSISIRWFAFKSPVSIIKPRDTCFLEIQNHFQLNNKNGYLIGMTSIPIGCCPEFKNTLGLIRAFHYCSGFLFFETDQPDVLKVIQLYQINLNGNIPKWIINLGIKIRVKNIRYMDKYIREKKLSTSIFLSEEDLIPKITRSKCFLCQKKINFIKIQCRKCGEVMCKNCIKLWSIQISGFEIKITVCISCSLGTRDYNAKSILNESEINFFNDEILNTTPKPIILYTEDDINEENYLNTFHFDQMKLNKNSFSIEETILDDNE